MSGVYAQVSLVKKDANIISNILWRCLDGARRTLETKILNPDDYHVTLLYSRVGNVDEIGLRNTHYDAEIKDIELWTENDPVLVCTLTSPKLARRHEFLMERHSLQWDYPEYKPHVTLAYNLPLTEDKVNMLRDKLVGRALVLHAEHAESLDENAT